MATTAQVWGSTKLGELLTGSMRWRAELHDSHFTLFVGDKGELSAHLFQVDSMDVFPGILWATCRFNVRLGNNLTSISYDGIPNQQAKSLATSLVAATVTALADFIASRTLELNSWLDRAISEIRLAPGAIVSDSEIRDALANARPPATPADLSWSTILRHKQVSEARRLASQWPSWRNTPEEELANRVLAHNEATFKRSFDAWLDLAGRPANENRWIAKGMASRQVARIPPPKWPGKTWKELVGDRDPQTTLRKRFVASNREHVARQKSSCKPFFDIVEKNPLTDEQVDACICMDDNVLIVAAAGSGKTSTMVAKTGYVLDQELATPQQVLLLAFNRGTADELSDRIAERLHRVPNIQKVRSNTFHSFGIEVIAKATGRKPALAPWVDPEKPGADTREVAAIIQDLSAADARFKREWDIFRTVFGRDVGKWGLPAEADC